MQKIHCSIKKRLLKNHVCKDVWEKGSTKFDTKALCKTSTRMMAAVNKTPLLGLANNNKAASGSKNIRLFQNMVV